MYLLILNHTDQQQLHLLYLHPTMYLLILSSMKTSFKFLFLFTSHYVSINSQRQIQSLTACKNLHPTMYLLIRDIFKRDRMMKLNLHPTMYLLIPSPLFVYIPLIIFTSHYVSINSNRLHRISIFAPEFTSHYVSINSSGTLEQDNILNHLHPTMYLLIHLWMRYKDSSGN